MSNLGDNQKEIVKTNDDKNKFQFMTPQFDSRNNIKSLDGPTLKLDDEFDDD